ncbi:hypothetical protein C1X61_07950 [Pseudomonas sp. FW215-T2]|nr:hypothetical protein C1X61_07950 [Pseudomonas sp. FW215-T2]PNA13180.1 hypothetical protein C1X62_10300 [Pseudomonas sp. FW215-R3]PNB38060.1 hypothetical protein C1X63_10265 [Pseudomonas sp. FW305-131]
MVVNDDASILDVRGVFESIASRLAPTVSLFDRLDLSLQRQVPAIGKGRCTCIKSGMSRHLIQAWCW